MTGELELALIAALLLTVATKLGRKLLLALLSRTGISRWLLRRSLKRQFEMIRDPDFLERYSAAIVDATEEMIRTFDTAEEGQDIAPSQGQPQT